MAAKSVFPAYNFVTSHLSTKRKNLVKIDNTVFWFHYRCTALFFLGVTVIVFGSQYFGSHIQCMADSGVPIKVINTYCFTLGTFTILEGQGRRPDSAHPGIGPHSPEENDASVIYHAYYQWIPYMLFFQAMLFYAPHILWKAFEDGRIKNLVHGFENSELAFKEDKDVKTTTDVIPSKTALNLKISNVKNAFIQRIRVNKFWGAWMVACESINLVNLALQIYLMHRFLGNKFWNLGPDALNSDFSYLDVVFPKVAKCTFHKYGPSGSIQNHDALCVLTLNVFYEKVYLILWFWFAFLIFVTLFNLLFRFGSVLAYRRSVSFNKLVFKTRDLSAKHICSLMTIAGKCNYSNWLFLYYLSKNLNPRVFRSLLDSIAQDIYIKDIDQDFDIKDITQVVDTHDMKKIEIREHENFNLLD